MNVIQAQCFTCYEGANFNYHGQTAEYNPHQDALDYVKAYEAKVRPVIECVSCGRRVQYDKGSDGVYRDVAVPKINREES